MSGIEDHEHDVAEVYGAARKNHDHRDIKARLEFVEEVTDKLLKLAESSADSLEKATARIIELGAELDRLRPIVGGLSERVAALEDALSLLPGGGQ